MTKALLPKAVLPSKRGSSTGEAAKQVMLYTLLQTLCSREAQAAVPRLRQEPQDSVSGSHFPPFQSCTVFSLTESTTQIFPLSHKILTLNNHLQQLSYPRNQR